MKKIKMFCAVMAVSLLALAGCGSKKVTAESLVQGMVNQEKQTSSDLNMIIDVDMDIPIDEGSSMKFKVYSKSHIQSTEKASHMEGDVQMSFFGMDMNQPMNVWYDHETKKSYSYDSDNDQWEVADYDEDLLGMADFSELDMAGFQDLILEETGKDQDYVVTSNLDSKALEQFLGEADMVSDLGLTDSDEDYNIKAAMTFDRKDKSLKTFKLDLDMSQVEGMEDATVNTFSITIEINPVDRELSITVPEDVKENAVEASSYDDDWDYDWDDEDGYDGDDDYDWGDDDYDWEDYDSEDPEIVKAELLSQFPALAGIDDIIGSYAGTSISLGMDMAVFAEDGWVQEEKDSMYYINDKYTDVSLKLYDFGWSGEIDELKENGVWGYMVTAEYADEDALLPNLTLKNGITWGADVQAVIDAYGEPQSTYGDIDDEESSIGYTYEIGDDCELEFTFNSAYRDGLVAVSFIYY